MKYKMPAGTVGTCTVCGRPRFLLQSGTCHECDSTQSRVARMTPTELATRTMILAVLSANKELARFEASRIQHTEVAARLMDEVTSHEVELACIQKVVR